MILYVRKNRRKYNRLGITVGKKVGCAVKRNRARRIIRQAYRETEHLLPTGIDLVIVALPAIDGIRSTQLRDYLAGNGLQRIRRMFAPPEGENREVSSGMADWRISENFPADTGCVPVLSPPVPPTPKPPCCGTAYCGAGSLPCGGCCAVTRGTLAGSIRCRSIWIRRASCLQDENPGVYYATERVNENEWIFI